LSPCLIKHYTIKMYKRVEVQLHTLALDVSNQLHALSIG